ncbi:hypothetical protein HDU92_000434, partial [Lobulomyces angularis]
KHTKLLLRNVLRKLNTELIYSNNFNFGAIDPQVNGVFANATTGVAFIVYKPLVREVGSYR